MFRPVHTLISLLLEHRESRKRLQFLHHAAKEIKVLNKTVDFVDLYCVQYVP